MKLILLSHVPINGKDGRKWDKVYALSEKGKMVEPFMDRDSFEKLGFSDSDFLSTKDVEDVFKTFASVDLSFDANGRVESYTK